MITGAFEYIAPASVAEAVDLLQRYGADARLLAGGHSLIPTMKLRRVTPAILLDLGRIPELRGIHYTPDAVTIGAMTTHADLEYATDLRDLVPLLPQAAKVVSDPLIRNRGTFGGALAQADPEGDWPAVALALNARLIATGPDGQRAIASDDFFVDAHTTALRADDVLTAIKVPIPAANTHTAYLKRMHPASGYAVVGVAVTATFAEDGVCLACRIGVTGAGRKATRAVKTEQLLVGQQLTPDLIATAAERAGDLNEFIGDPHASATFRAHLVKVYVKRALSQVTSGARDREPGSGVRNGFISSRRRIDSVATSTE
jgi:carbon-monoxide dehydrogenase medium subunit